MTTTASQDRVLVAFGSKHGATAEIADRIASTLLAEGLDVELLPARAVGDLTSYRAVVLGSAVYVARWRRDARHLLRRRELADKRLWLFSSGPLDTSPEELRKAAPPGVKRAARRLGAVDHAVFGGRVPTSPTNFVERSIVDKTPPEKRDARDWAAIEAWSREIAAALGSPAARAA